MIFHLTYTRWFIHNSWFTVNTLGIKVINLGSYIFKGLFKCILIRSSCANKIIGLYQIIIQISLFNCWGDVKDLSLFLVPFQPLRRYSKNEFVTCIRSWIHVELMFPIIEGFPYVGVSVYDFLGQNTLFALILGKYTDIVGTVNFIS